MRMGRCLREGRSWVRPAVGPELMTSWAWGRSDRGGRRSHSDGGHQDPTSSAAACVAPVCFAQGERLISQIHSRIPWTYRATGP